MDFKQAAGVAVAACTVAFTVYFNLESRHASKVELAAAEEKAQVREERNLLRDWQSQWRDIAGWLDINIKALHFYQKAVTDHESGVEGAEPLADWQVDRMENLETTVPLQQEEARVLEKDIRELKKDIERDQ